MKVPIKCICPPKGDEVRHPNGDTIVLLDRLSFRGVVAIQKDAEILRFRQGGAVSIGTYLAALTEGYLVHGIESWTVRDEKNQPVDPTQETIGTYLLDGNQAVAMEVGEIADNLYSEQVTVPLLEAVAKSSQDSSTADSTSPTTDGASPEPIGNRSSRRSRKQPTPLKRSSTSTTPTDAIETTSSSLDGDFSSSPNSASAA